MAKITAKPKAVSATRVQEPCAELDRLAADLDPVDEVELFERAVDGASLPVRPKSRPDPLHENETRFALADRG